MYKVSDTWLRKILIVLYEKRQTTRAEIVAATRLNVASVSQALRHLIDAGVVQKQGELQSPAGRRRDDLKLSSETGYFIAVDLEGTRVRFGLANFLGDIRCRWEEPFARNRALDIDTFVRGIAAVQNPLSARERSRVLAIGVSYSGMMDREGRVTAVNFGWDDYPLAKNLSAVANMPVFTATECLTKLIAERWLGAARAARDVVYVTVANGVGIACMADGKVISGRDGFAGEFGHTNIDPQAQDECNCGKRGCLEAIASSPAIVRYYLETSGKGGDIRWDQVSEVFDLARAGDRAAIAAVERAARCLGNGLANVVNILNPELIVLGGDVLHAPDLFLPLIQKTIEERALPKLHRGLEVKCSALGFDNGLVGAASLAFHKAVHDPVLLHRIASRQEAQKPRRRRAKAVKA